MGGGGVSIGYVEYLFQRLILHWIRDPSPVDPNMRLDPVLGSGEDGDWMVSSLLGNFSIGEDTRLFIDCSSSL